MGMDIDVKVTESRLGYVMTIAGDGGEEVRPVAKVGIGLLWDMANDFAREVVWQIIHPGVEMPCPERTNEGAIEVDPIYADVLEELDGLMGIVSIDMQEVSE